MQHNIIQNHPIRSLPGNCLRVGLLMLIACCCARSARAEVVYSKSLRFRIPFQFDAAELKRLGTKEVQLYVSQDGGAHWQHADSVSPETSKFTFEAPEDGSYWFSVKSVAGSGLIYPAGPHQAGLNVLVDSTPPEISLQLEEVEPGRVRLSWAVHDANLDLSTLKLEFRDSSSDLWSLVAVRTQRQGQTSWTTTQTGAMEVRGEVADIGGNVTQVTASCQIPERAPRNDKPDFSKPLAGESMPVPVAGADSNLTSNQSAITSKLTSTATMPNVPVKEAAASGPAAGATQLPSSNADRIPSNPHHKVNSNTFRVAYNLDAVGPSGIRQVDLFITEDNGQRWFHYGQDPDRTSPMEVTVPRDGEYGLSFRVTNGLGRVANPPQPNEPPEVRITVDRTPPAVQLKSIEHAPEVESSKVVITWTAQDKDLPERPVGLFYSVAPTGPWESMEGWLPNIGKFSWNVPAALDQPFYVRIDVKDQAGNVTRIYAEKPFVVDRAIPRAHVTEVEPLNAASR